MDNLIKRQLEIRDKIRLKKYHKIARFIGGVDVASRGTTLVACIAIFSFPDLNPIEETFALKKIKIPYVPTFLAFREMPVILSAYKKLKTESDILLVDGQGIAHPRYCGIAAHLGVKLNKATIGCAKSPLFGNYSIPGLKRGEWTPVRYNNRKIGIVLRTRTNVKPLFVSPGNFVNFADCIRYVLATTIKYRIPEPIRYAHIKARAKLIEHFAQDKKEAECLK